MPGVSNCSFCSFHPCVLRVAMTSSTAVRQFRFSERDRVYSQGLPADGLFFIQKGSLSLTVSDSRGNTRISRFVGPGELCGLDAFLPHRTHVSTAIAREDCQMCFVEAAGFTEVVGDCDKYAWQLFLVVNQLLHASDIEKLELSGNCVQRRLRQFFARFGTLRGDRHTGSSTCRQTLKQWEIAQYLGVSQETICRELKKLNNGKGGTRNLPQGEKK